MRIPLFLRSLATLGLLTACGGASSTNDADSNLKWAHSPADRSISTINSRLHFLDLNFKNDFPKISVCLQTSGTYEASALLLETKLAYAAWLDASGFGKDETFARFDFVPKTSCAMNDVRYGSVVVISEEAKITPDQEIDNTFKKSVVNCKRVGFSANCSTGSMTMGIGGPGSIGYTYFKPEIWESVTSRSPATVLLSPFVKWTSMEQFLTKKEAGLGALYSRLKAKATSVSYSELKELNDLIADRKLVLDKNGQLDAIVQSFLDSKKTSLTETYIPTMAAYHVLLHEVGHQFGMSHADNPGRDSVTGPSQGAKQNANGQWQTDLSTMAYADSYIYLTPDDVEGIQNLASESLAFLKTKKRK